MKKKTLALIAMTLICTSAIQAQLTTIYNSSGSMVVGAFENASNIRQTTVTKNNGKKKERSKITLLNYDASATEISGTYNAKWIDKGKKKGGFYTSNFFSTKLAIGLKENTFTLFKDGFKPGYQLATEYTRQIQPNDGDARYYSLFNIGVKNNNSLLKNGIISLDTVLTLDKKWNNDLELSGYYNFISLKGTKGIRWIFGVGASVGYESNSGDHLDEVNFCKTTGSRLVYEDEFYDRRECDKRYDGKFQDVRYTSISVFFSHRIVQLDTSNTDILNFVSYFTTTFKDRNIPRYDLSIGLSLNKFPNKVMTSILFKLEDIANLKKEDKDLSDVFSIGLHFGIPIGILKK